jgi:hypothetical protein
MRKYVWISIVLLIIGYFAWDHFSKKAKEEQKEAQIEKRKIESNALVEAMVIRTGANKVWREEVAGGDQYVFDPIYTIALEKVWLTGRPILLTGRILDIASLNDSSYVVEIESHGRPRFYDLEFRFRLAAKKNRIDEFLRENPQIGERSYEDNVAVIGMIKSIRQGKTLTAELDGEEVYQDEKEVKIGEGELLELLYSENLD